MRLNEIFEAYKDDVNFLCVYITEAHPEDGWIAQSNRDEGIKYLQPTTIEERADVAEACVLSLDLKMPTVLDDMTNHVDLSYSALPMRLYLIGSDGTIAYQGGPGPFKFDTEEWLTAINGELDKVEQQAAE